MFQCFIFHLSVDRCSINHFFVHENLQSELQSINGHSTLTFNIISIAFDFNWGEWCHKNRAIIFKTFNSTNEFRRMTFVECHLRLHWEWKLQKKTDYLDFSVSLGHFNFLWDANTLTFPKPNGWMANWWENNIRNVWY